MKSGLLFAFAAALAGLAAIGGAQEPPPPQPSFSITISGPQGNVRVGLPIAVKVTLTNTSDHDVADVLMPNRESKSKVMRMIDLKVYDSDGKLVPETPHGRRIHGRDQMVFPTVVSFSIKPGKSTHEEADLTEEFDLGKPGKYKVQAEQHDPDTRVLVKSNIISVTLVQ